MTTLRERILKAAEFDAGWARRDLRRALVEADEHNELSEAQLHHLTLLNIKSAHWENARLIPLITALADALDKAREQRDFYLKDARDEFDQKWARETDEAELERILLEVLK